jgi:hypothetical protein
MHVVDYAVAIAAARAAGKEKVLLPCPGHDDRHPSFVVSTTKPIGLCYARCHGTKWVPITKFLPQIDLSIWGEDAGAAKRGGGPGAVRSHRANVLLKEALALLVSTEDALRRGSSSLRLPEEALAWIRSRGLRPRAVAPWVYHVGRFQRELLRLSYAPSELEEAGLFARGRWFFEGGVALLVARDEHGRPTWCQLVSRRRSSGAKYLSPRGSALGTPFGLDTLRDARSVVLAEGVVDALSVVDAHGIPGGPRLPGPVGVLGVAGVHQWRPGVAELVAKTKATKVVVAFDADDAGQQAAERAMRDLRRVGVRAQRFSPTGGAKDLNDLLGLSRAASPA